MEIKFHVIFLIVVSINSYCNGIKYSSLEKTYFKGVSAYSGNRWSECIAQLESALHLFKLYKSIILNCRNACNTINYESQIESGNGDLKIYEKFFQTRECLKNCKLKEFEKASMKDDVQETTLNNIKNRQPYEYLHICYFQMNRLPKAASAAFTYYVAHPNDDKIMMNLDFYLAQQEVDASEVVDMETQNFENLYKKGLESYEVKSWKETITSMDKALNDYMLWETYCRLECEEQSPYQLSMEFTITVSFNIELLLQCQQKCQDKLKILHYNSGLEFLADVLNYLQISHYKLGNYEKAAECVASYLKLLPGDEDMLINKEIYSSLVNEKAFSIRSDIQFYSDRDYDEKKLLKLFHKGSNVKANNP